MTFREQSDSPGLKIMVHRGKISQAAKKVSESVRTMQTKQRVFEGKGNTPLVWKYNE